MVTPVDVDKYEELLRVSGYDHTESEFLVNGFRNGFDIGFRGDIQGMRRTAPNLKFRIGNEVILWNKVMKEVKAKRYAGPFKEAPFKNFIQSPVGLVPKDDGKDTRLIFHLSYPRKGFSVNSQTPERFCKVKYCDFSDAIMKIVSMGAKVVGKSDMKSAFRNLGILPSQFCVLILKAKSPFDGKYYFFVDKALPFGSSASCNLFSRLANSVAHLAEFRSHGNRPVNYLDDYLFAAYLARVCNDRIQEFLDICEEIKFRVSLEKTYWATTLLVFLGLLIDTLNKCICIPTEKISRAITLIEDVIGGKKTTVRKLQKLCGFLNFLCKCIVPGRAFTRRLYSYFSSSMLPHHHVRVSGEMRRDLNVWKTFLNDPSAYCRPFIDYWFQQKWDDFTLVVNPSIQYKELFAVVASVNMDISIMIF